MFAIGTTGGHDRRRAARRAGGGGLAGSLGAILRHGRPNLLIRHGRSAGDSLLCTALFRELRIRGHNRLWMQTDYPALFENNPDVDRVVPYDHLHRRLTTLLGGRAIHPVYAAYDPATDRSTPPDRQIIGCMCRQVGIRGEVSLRPYVHLSEAEWASGLCAEGQIAIQSSGLGARLPMRNKEWGAALFQDVVDALRGRNPIVQVGGRADPPLHGAFDARGEPLRRSAAILSRSVCFVGLNGFWMHLARASECRAVIVFGGREAPWQSGYSANENLYTDLPCAPCWLWNRCDYERRCLTAIEPAAVARAVERQLALSGQPLPVDRDVL
jgi:hypothetical protein